MLVPRRRFSNIILAVSVVFLVCFLYTRFGSQLPPFKLGSVTRLLPKNFLDQWKTAVEHPPLTTPIPQPSIQFPNDLEQVVLAPPTSITF